MGETSGRQDLNLRNLSLPKRALYQAELRPDQRRLFAVGAVRSLEQERVKRDISGEFAGWRVGRERESVFHA